MSITGDIYAHLTAETAREAVDAMAAVLDAAEAEARATRRARKALADTAVSAPAALTHSPRTHLALTERRK